MWFVHQIVPLDQCHFNVKTNFRILKRPDYKGRDGIRRNRVHKIIEQRELEKTERKTSRIRARGGKKMEKKRRGKRNKCLHDILNSADRSDVEKE